MSTFDLISWKQRALSRGIHAAIRREGAMRQLHCSAAKRVCLRHARVACDGGDVFIPVRVAILVATQSAYAHPYAGAGQRWQNYHSVPTPAR